MGKRYAKKGLFICDRSGFEYPISEMVKEPGTGYIVHKSMSDGKYNIVDHPQNFSKAEKSDGRVIKNARPLEDVNNNFLVDEEGNFILVEIAAMFGKTQSDTFEVQI